MEWNSRLVVYRRNSEEKTIRPSKRTRHPSISRPAIIITEQTRLVRVLPPPSEWTSNDRGSRALYSPGGADVGPGGH